MQQEGAKIKEGGGTAATAGSSGLSRAASCYDTTRRGVSSLLVHNVPKTGYSADDEPCFLLQA